MARSSELDEVDLQPREEHQQELANIGEELGHFMTLWANIQAVRSK
jgi:hypothetical protein